MPLPAALLKRLSKRGILNDGTQKAASKDSLAEEIIAEDYDDDNQEPSIDADLDYQNPMKNKKPNFWSERLKRRIIDGNINFKGYRACPNKYNVHHKCTLFCINTFGDGIQQPNSKYLKRKERLLRKYPLPSEWKDIFDEGSGVHFYWNTNDNTVSWLPPTHPRAVISRSAAAMRKELENAQQQDNYDDTNVDTERTVDLDRNVENKYANVPKESAASMPPPSKPQPPRKSRDLEKTLRAKREKRMKRDAKDGALDPMDPASYSDIARGKWSAGLENENHKTGVDSSVTGTMFQMRPYPSPGAILKANNARKPKGDDKNSDDSNDSDQNS